MAQSGAARVRQLYDSFAAGDAATVIGSFDPGIMWNEAEGFVYADGNPYIGPQRIAEGVFARLATEWDGFQVLPETLIDGGERVVALGRYRGSYRATGRAVDAQFAHVWTLRDGRVTAFQQYTDTAQFARAVETTVPPPLA